MTQPSTGPQTSYDRVPYKSHPFPQTHPDRLATIATLFGMRPAPVERCRVLELGCASGGNLLPMADQFPNSRFVGIDASSRQIADGSELLARSGLTNVELRCQDILQFTCEEPFDFIICHGVYSWVPDPVQQKILEICREGLAPNGVAYVSYNTYPGWHMRGMIRDIMRYRAQSFDDPRQKLNQARGLLTFLSNSVKGEHNPYGLLLRQELESIGRSDDSYLLHEHLEDVNEPLYFHEFAERAGRAGMQYLGEADFGVMSVENFPEQVRGMLLSVSRDTIEVEQYMDFLRNRAFRQTLLCRDDVSLDRSAPHHHLSRLRIATNARPEVERSDSAPSDPAIVQPSVGREPPVLFDNIDIANSAPLVFRRGGGTLTTTDSVVKAAILHLSRVWPASMPFVELASLARSTATGRPAAVGGDVMSSTTEPVASTLLRCFATSTVDLRSTAPRFVGRVSNAPTASSLARAQAAGGPNVTNRLHETVSLDDVQRQVLARCDGRNSPPDLINHLCEAVIGGDLILHHEGRRITDRDTAHRLATEVLPSVLTGFAQRALLIE
ncbi:MAG: class I SAM-dependent methyltransferase [Planctomycetota bacterium]